MTDELKIAEGFVDDKMEYGPRMSWGPVRPLTPEQVAQSKKLSVEARKAIAEMNRREIAEGKARKLLVAYLRRAGVEIEISGCGCCDSPTVKYRVGKKTIEVVNANVSTLKP